jgi:hypothetical protein
MNESSDWERYLWVRWSTPKAPPPTSCSVCGAAVSHEALRLWTDDGYAAVLCGNCTVLLVRDHFAIVGPQR